MLLVKRGVELRGEATIAHQTLVDMADETYFGERMPEKPPNFTNLGAPKGKLGYR